MPYLMTEERIEDLMEWARSLDARKSDFRLPLAGLSFNDKAEMVLPYLSGVTSYPMTDHALGQVCDRLGPPPRQYMKACPPALRAANLNHWREADRGRQQWLVRTNGPDVRGVLSNRYLPIDNSLVLAKMAEVLRGQAYKVVRPWLDADGMRVKVTVADDEGGNYAIGVAVTNGEIGNSALSVSPFIQRHSCTNSIVYEEGGFRQTHVVRASNAFLFALLKEKMGQMLRFSATMLERVVAAEAERVPRFADVVGEVCRKHGLSQEVGQAVLMGSEGSATRMGLVNGLSWAAQRVEGVAQIQQLEGLAGAILAEGDDLFAVIGRRRASVEVE